MRIAMLLSNPFRPDPRVLKEATSLESTGHQVVILAWDRQAEMEPTSRISPGIEIRRVQDVPSGYGLGVAQISRLVAFWRKAIPMLDRLQPEAIHCHDFDTLPAGLWWGKRHKIPVIYDAHEYYADLVLPRLKPPFGPAVYAIIKWLEFHASRRVSAIITVDETLAAHYQPTSQPVLIIGHYPSLNFASHQAPVFSRDQLVLLYAGRLSTDRGILDYLQILRLLRQLGIPARLRLAGVFTPASEQDQFTEQARGLESWLDILGWVAYQDLPDLVSEADVGLALLHPVPRYTVALPVKLFEYMAAGLPVLASDFLPIRHVVVPSKAGALLLPGDPHLAAGILESWWKDPTIPQRLGQNARQAVLERYNWEMLAEKLADLYTSLVP